MRNDLTDQGTIEGHRKLQYFLQSAGSEEVDEKVMFTMDKEVNDNIENLLKSLVKLPEIEL